MLLINILDLLNMYFVVVGIGLAEIPRTIIRSISPFVLVIFGLLKAKDINELWKKKEKNKYFSVTEGTL